MLESADHCYDKNAVEQMLWLLLIATNLFELFFHQGRNDPDFSGGDPELSRIHMVRLFLDDMLLHAFRRVL
jgi:hypothetical protein